MTTGERPRGPAHVYASVCQPSSWISELPSGAIYGLRGVAGMPVMGWDVAGLPEYVGVAGVEGIGTAGTAGGNGTDAPALGTVNAAPNRTKATR